MYKLICIYISIINNLSVINNIIAINNINTISAINMINAISIINMIDASGICGSGPGLAPGSRGSLGLAGLLGPNSISGALRAPRGFYAKAPGCPGLQLLARGSKCSPKLYILPKDLTDRTDRIDHIDRTDRIDHIDRTDRINHIDCTNRIDIINRNNIIDYTKIIYYTNINTY